MTVVSDARARSTAAPAAAPSDSRASLPGTWFEQLAVGATLAWSLVWLARGNGGRDPGPLSITALLLLPALWATKPWRRLPAWQSPAAALVAVCAFAVCLFAPTGWAGANDAASYAVVAALFLVTRSYLQRGRRHVHVLAAVAVAGGIQFAESWLAWWGGGDPTHRMVGTFYWHNQFAAFLLAPALISLGFAVWTDRRYRVLGWVLAPMCAVGVVLSTSRAALACLVAGWLTVLLAAVIRAGRRRAVAGWLAATVLAVGAFVAVTGPPFFAHRGSPLSASGTRVSSGETLDGSGSFRVNEWKLAGTGFERRPWAGTGYHGLIAATADVHVGARSPLAHNGYLQALSDGGLLLGVPFLLACLAIVTGLLRRLWSGLRSRTDGPHLAVVAPLAALAVLAHSLVDFDWSYPALFAATAIICAVALQPVGQRLAAGAAERRTPVVAVVGTLVVAAALVGAAAGARHGELALTVFPHHAAHSPGAAR